MLVEILHKGRFHPLPEAGVRKVAANAWQVRIPREAASLDRLRRDWTEEAWDGVILSLDGREMEPAVTSAIDPSSLTLSVLHLG